MRGVALRLLVAARRDGEVALVARCVRGVGALVVLHVARALERVGEVLERRVARDLEGAVRVRRHGRGRDAAERARSSSICFFSSIISFGAIL